MSWVRKLTLAATVVMLNVPVYVESDQPPPVGADQIGVAPAHDGPGPVPKCAAADQSEAVPPASHVRTRQE